MLNFYQLIQMDYFGVIPMETILIKKKYSILEINLNINIYLLSLIIFNARFYLSQKLNFQN